MATRAWGHQLANHDQAWSHRKVLRQCKLIFCVQVGSPKGVAQCYPVLASSTFQKLLLCRRFRQYSRVAGKFGIDILWIFALLLLKFQIYGDFFLSHSRQLLHRCNSFVCAADVCFWQAALCVHKSWFGEKCVAMEMLCEDWNWFRWGAWISPCTTSNNRSSHSFSTSKVDVSKAKTKIQIRFHDGTRKAQEFNEDRGFRSVARPSVAIIGIHTFHAFWFGLTFLQDHTVGDLRAFCAQCVGGQAASSWKCSKTILSKAMLGWSCQLATTFRTTKIGEGQEICGQDTRKVCMERENILKKPQETNVTGGPQVKCCFCRPCLTFCSSADVRPWRLWEASRQRQWRFHFKTLPFCGFVCYERYRYHGLMDHGCSWQFDAIWSYLIFAYFCFEVILVSLCSPSPMTASPWKMLDCWMQLQKAYHMMWQLFQVVALSCRCCSRILLPLALMSECNEVTVKPSWKGRDWGVQAFG